MALSNYSFQKLEYCLKSDHTKTFLTAVVVMLFHLSINNFSTTLKRGCHPSKCQQYLCYTPSPWEWHHHSLTNSQKLHKTWTNSRSNKHIIYIIYTVRQFRNNWQHIVWKWVRSGSVQLYYKLSLVKFRFCTNDEQIKMEVKANVDRK